MVSHRATEEQTTIPRASIGGEVLKPTPTRTLNPLPFGDLEPHRFEDLVRQLAYDLRRWTSLEATGRGGSDSGMDIRGVELVPVDGEKWGDDQELEEGFLERLWIFQCKREKSLAPKRIRKIVEESLTSAQTPPHGFILAAACDISKEGRDAFREEMVARGVEEFAVWAKSELEDLLFQPKNDRLLFAYFGIALQPKRRNLSTVLRADITKKKQLTALIADEEQRDGKLVLLRDPSDDRYPYEPKGGGPPARWLLCRTLTTRKPGHLIVLQREHLAAISEDGKTWDAILDFDTMLYRAENDLRNAHAWNLTEYDHNDRSPYDFWNEYIAESRRAYLKISRAVPLDRILALDPLGDGFFPIPHILVDFVEKTGPFTAEKYPRLELISNTARPIDINVTDENRGAIFPNPLPDGNGPEPAGFDDTGKASPLTGQSDARLQVLLAKAAPREEKSVANANTNAKEDKESRNVLDEFRDWREKVGVPVFSAFVHKIRSAGHHARVVVRSASPDPEVGSPQGFERVEMRVRFRGGHYFRGGSVSITVQGHRPVWRTEISPAERDSRGNSRLSNSDTNVEKSTTKEQLETLILNMLARMQAE